ncbi:MAG: hypothetical protein AAF682_01735 [Planctomycetota bacterium]
MRHRLFACLAAASIGVAAQGQVPLLQTGDDVPGLGVVGYPSGPVLNASGGWLCVGTSTYAEQGLVRDGQAVVVVGAKVRPGVQLLGLWEYGLDSGGGAFWTGPVDAPWLGPVPTAVGLDDAVLRMTGDLCDAPEVAPGTVYAHLGDLSWTDQRKLLVRGSIDDPAHEGGPKTALLLIEVDDAGAVVSERVLLKEGDSLPGQLKPVSSAGPGEGADLSNAGDLISTPSFGGKGAVYWNTVLLAETGGAAPVPGRTWKQFFCAETNDQGDHAYLGHLEGDPKSGALIVRNGEKLVQTGDVLPDVAPYAIEAISPDRIELAEDGTVGWIGSFAGEHGLFLDQRLVLATGQELDGKPVTFLGTSGFSLLADGLSAGLYVGFGDGSYAAYDASFATFLALPGCASNPGSLEVVEGAPVVGGALTFAMDTGQLPGVFPFLAVSSEPPGGWPTCGLVIPGAGELLISIDGGDPLTTLFSGLAWTGTPSFFELGLPPGLHGVELAAQGMFVDIAGVSTSEPFRLTDAVRMQVGI